MRERRKKRLNGGKSAEPQLNNTHPMPSTSFLDESDKSLME